MIKSLLLITLFLSNTILFAQYSNYVDLEFAENGRLNLDLVDSTLQISNMLVRVDDENNIFVCSRLPGEIQIYKFDVNGELVEEFGLEGNLSMPYDGNQGPMRHYIIIDNLHYLIPPGETTACIFSFNSNGEVQEVLNSALSPDTGSIFNISGFISTNNYLYKLIAKNYSYVTANFLYDILRYNLDGELDTSYNFEINQTVNGEPIISSNPYFTVSESDEIYMQFETSIDTLRSSNIIKVSNSGKFDSLFGNSGHYELDGGLKSGNRLNYKDNSLYYVSSNYEDREFHISRFDISENSIELIDSRTFQPGEDSQYRNLKFHDFGETIFYLEQRFDISWSPTYSIISFDESINEFEYYEGSYRLTLVEGYDATLGDFTMDKLGRHYILIENQEGCQLIRLNNAITNSVHEQIPKNRPKVFPTLIESHVSIDLDGSFFNNFEILDSRGKTIKFGQLVDQNNIIQIPNLNKGLYFLVLRNENREIIPYKLFKF